MTSHKQTAANRRNARAATGPKTEDGKSIAAQNAMKHGLRASVSVVVPDIEDERDWEAHRAGIFAAMQPIGYFETMLCDRIAAQAWRLARACRYETAMIQTAQETVEDDLNEQSRLFRRGSLGDTHPEDIRGRLRDAKTLHRVLKRLSDLPNDAPFKPNDAAALVWCAFDTSGFEGDVSLPGIPDDADLYELAEFEDFTAGQVRACIEAVANAAGIPVSDLGEDITEHARLELTQARIRADEMERELEHIRRQRRLPIGDLNHEKLHRYETTLERSLFRTLHELQRLQATRIGGDVPAPAVLDVDVRAGE